MTSDRNTRLTAKLTACSTTPRSGRALVEALSHQAIVAREHQLYAEAKLALLDNDVDTATHLFELCPRDYRNTMKYIDYCKTYHDLVARGLVQRATTEPLRRVLARILACGADTPLATSYAERLAKAGFAAEQLDSLTLADADHVYDVVRPHLGARLAMERHFATNTSCAVKLTVAITRSIARCGGVARCVQVARSATRPLKSERNVEDDEEEETGK